VAPPYEPQSADPDRARKLALWDDFCVSHQIAARSVPLFAADASGFVVVKPFGVDRRLLLQRSAAMEEVLAAAAETVIQDYDSRRAEFEGILYLMHLLEGDQVLPLYIGRAGKIGVNGGLSANLQRIRANLGKFARWGSNYAYHIGDLSAVVCPGHSPAKQSPKYARWAQRLFHAVPSENPQLRREVRFSALPWRAEGPSIWRDYGRSSLAFQEYLLIGVASDLFPEHLLNDEGVNRRRLANTPLEGLGA
jgi:hypothetical protein